MPSPPAPSAAHLSSAAGSRSSARRAGTCEWSCRSESASRGSCTGPRSRRCTCHLRSERAAGSPGARKRPLQERDGTASATGKLPVGHVQRRTEQVHSKAFHVRGCYLGSWQLRAHTSAPEWPEPTKWLCPAPVMGSQQGAGMAQQTLYCVLVGDTRCSCKNCHGFVHKCLLLTLTGISQVPWGHIPS